MSDILSLKCGTGRQEPATGKRAHIDSLLDFALRFVIPVAQRAQPDGRYGIGKIYGQEKEHHDLQPRARMNMLLHGVKDTESEIFTAIR